MSDTSHDPNQMTGAAMIVRALIDHGVEHIFGYPGGAVLPIYDEIFQQSEVEHILVRHEQGAGHAAEGYARSTGKPGVVLVTSGPGATNMVTPLTDALMDSIPLVCITGQVPTHLDRQRRVPGMRHRRHHRPCTKHNWLVRDVNDLAKVLHEAFYVATTGRPGPVVVGCAEGRAVRDRHLSSAAQVRRASVLYAAAQGRRSADPQGGGAAGVRQSAR
jgi:acetolactate synthase-1/2/3 large subunit